MKWIEPLTTFVFLFAVMGFVTYILLVGILLGRANKFHPALLGSTASTAFAVLVSELIMVRLGCYLLGVGQEGGEGWMDVASVLGYKFVGWVERIESERTELSGVE